MKNVSGTLPCKLSLQGGCGYDVAMRSLRCFLIVLICCYEVVWVFLLLSYWLKPKKPNPVGFLVSRYGSGPNFNIILKDSSPVL